MTLRRKTPLRKRSKRMAAEMVRYNALRAGYLDIVPICEVCDRERSTEVHHVKPLGRGGERNNLDNFLAVCRGCHNKIHADPKWAEENGHLKR